MNVTIIGAGNSGLAMAAHLSVNGNKITLWNRTEATLMKLKKTRTIKCSGVITGEIKIDSVTENMKQALTTAEVILVTTPANSHKCIAKEMAPYLKPNSLIVLNPGRTFGAYEFNNIIKEYDTNLNPLIAETQTIIYTCRKTDVDSVNILALKSKVLISGLISGFNDMIIKKLPLCIQPFLEPAESIIQTSIGNVGMILHCTPLLLNTGWTENLEACYKHYYDGITPSIGNLLHKIDEERVMVAKELGYKIETTKEWLERTYDVKGDTIYDCIRSNEVYKTIDAPKSLYHRYIMEDIPCGLVPLEYAGKELGLQMKYTSMIIDLASSLLDIDFRQEGRCISVVSKTIGGDKINYFIGQNK